MTWNLSNRKYVSIVPAFFVALFISGVIGIVAVSINDPYNYLNLEERTASLQPGEFEIVPIFIEKTDVRSKIDVTIINFNENNLPVFDKSIDLYYFDNSPSVTFGSDFKTQLTDEIDSDLVDQDLDVSLSSSIFVENQDRIYLAVVNPDTANTTFSVYLSISVYTADGGASAGYVLSIVGVSIFTFVIILLTIFAFYELFEPKEYKAKFLNDALEARLAMVVKNAESWELTILVLSFFVFPLGLTMSFTRVDGPWLFLSIAGIIGVYLNVTRRLNLYNAIRNMTATQRDIKLSQLALAVGRKVEVVRNAVFYLISHERFPIQYNAKTNVVTYTGQEFPVETTTLSTSPLDPVVEIKEEPQADIETNEHENESMSTPVCAYCGAEAIIAGAKFCQECGASMVAAK